MALGSSWTNIASGTFSSGGATLTYTIQARLDSQDIAANKSVVETRAKTAFSGNVMGGTGYEFTCTGCTSKSGSGVYYYSNETVLKDGSITVTHTSDGTKSVTISGTCKNDYLDMDISLSKSVELPTIPRASKPTTNKTSVTLDGSDSIVISTNRASDSFTHTLVLSFGSWSKTVTGVGASYTWSPDQTELMPLMSSYSEKVTVTCTTYKGSTKIGSDQKVTFTLLIDTSENYGGVSSYSLYDTNAATRAVCSANTFIKNASNVQATINLLANGSTTLVRANVYCGNTSQTFSLSGTSGQIVFTAPAVSDTTMVVSTTDNHGYTHEDLISLTLINYEPIQIVTATIERVNVNSEPSSTGEYLLCNLECIGFAGSFGAQSNTVTLYMKSKQADAQTYGSEVQMVSKTVSTTGSVTQILFENVRSAAGFDSAQQYDVVLTVRDIFSEASYTVIRVHEGIPVLGWGKDHVDTYGEFHTHDRTDSEQYITYGIDTNDEKSSARLMAYGYITSTGTRAVVFIPMTKLPVSPDITSLAVALRLTSGAYLLGSEFASVTLTDILSYSVVKEQSILKLTLQVSGYSSINNTPMVGEVRISYSAPQQT